MEQRVNGVAAGQEHEALWVLEHPPLYTAGTAAKQEDLLDPKRFPVYPAGRGGQYTYHGPGQCVVYVILDLRRIDRDLRALLTLLESWCIWTLQRYGVSAERKPGRTGIWVNIDRDRGKTEEKIGAIGLRVRKGVVFHGLSINVAPNLEHYRGIIPCGLSTYGVTSLEALGVRTTMQEFVAVLHQTFIERVAAQLSIQNLFEVVSPKPGRLEHQESV